MSRVTTDRKIGSVVIMVSFHLNFTCEPHLTYWETDDDEYDRRAPRRPRQGDESILWRLKKKFLQIAEDPKVLPEDEAQDISRILVENIHEDELKKQFFDIFIQLYVLLLYYSRKRITLTQTSLIEQPFKIPFAAAVILYTNHEKPEVATEILKRVTDRTQQFLNAGQWKEFKLFLRFLACIQGLLDDNGVFPILNQLFDVVVDLQSANENDVCGTILGCCSVLIITRWSASSLSRSSSLRSLMLCAPEDPLSKSRQWNY